MAVPPLSFSSFSPSSPPSEPSKESLPEIAPANALPILPPTDAPTGISETTATSPPTQSVTVVVSPNQEMPQGSSWPRWTFLGALLGLAFGIAGGWYYHTKQPGDFESTARVQVSGPAPAADAETQIAILRSRSVLTAAAKLDDLRPYQMPPDKDDAARLAFLQKGLSILPEMDAGAGSTLKVSFHGPHPADTPKYLRTIVEAYKADLTSRPANFAPGPRSTPLPPKQADAERERLQKELAALTPDEPAAIEKRLAAHRAAADQDQIRLHRIDHDLGLIRDAGASRRDRLAVMEELGIKADRPEVAPTVAADAKSAEESLRALQVKKAELGQRLGPEHRDMIALDEQMVLMKERIAKAKPAVPQGPDELERRRVALEAERTLLAARSGINAGIIAADQKLLGSVTGLRKRIDELIASQPTPAPKEAPSTVTPTAFSVQAVLPTEAGTRVSPELYRSLVPGGAIGLLSGAILGLIGSFLFAGSKSASRKPVRTFKPYIPPVVRQSSTAVAIPAGPRLGVPVFANVPKIDPSAPVEKRSGEGLSPLIVAFSRPTSTEADVFRIARRELTNALQNRGHQVIPVTSPGIGDGKSLVAANLAVSLAQSGKRVILVDCDLKNAKIQDLFRLTRLGDSLKSIMTSDVDLRMAVRTCEIPNLFVLPAGRAATAADAADLLSRPKFRELIAELKSTYEYVILDSPSTLAETEFPAVVGNSDGVVLVVRNGSDALSRSDRARGQVMEAGGRVLGAIVNAAPNVVDAPPAVTKELTAAK